MRVAVEEAVPEDHRHPRLGDPVGDLAPLLERRRDQVDVGELDPVDPLERQHARPRVLPVDLRHVDVRVAGEVAVEVLRVARLLPVVELLPDRARELVHELARVDEVERADPLAREPRRLVEEAEVGFDLLRRARPLHLDRDPAPVRQGRAVHLADRRGRDRRRLEVEEQPLERVPELLLDHPLGLLERERPHVVLQPAQLDDDVGRHDVGPGREELPELHERRPELVEHLAQVLAARGRRAVLGRDVGEAVLRRAARQEVAELVRLEEVAEAVAHHDLRDLRQAPDAAAACRAHRRKATRRVCRWPDRAAGLAPARPRAGRHEQRLGVEIREPDRGQVGEALDADVAAPPLREELPVERVEPLELEDVVGEQEPAAHERAAPASSRAPERGSRSARRS